MPQYYTPKDIGGFGRLADMKLRMRGEDRKDRESDLREKMMNVQFEQTKLNVQEAKRKLDLNAGLNEVTTNLKPGQNRFVQTYTYAQMQNAPKEANELMLGQQEQIDKLYKIDPEEAINMFNRTIGKVTNTVATYIPDKKDLIQVVTDGGETTWARYGKDGLTLVENPQGLKPPQKKGMKVYDSLGNLIVDTGGGEMSKKTQGGLEGDIVSSYDTLHQLEAVKTAYQRDFLTWKGKATSWWSDIKDKAGSELSEDDAKFAKSKKKFDQRVNSFFNTYRKLITGAAASVQELEDLKKAVINTDLGPNAFEAAYDDLVQNTQRAIRIKRKLLREGVKWGTKDGVHMFLGDGGDRFDALYMEGGDDTANARAEEIKKQNPTKSNETIAQMLMAEGYR